MAPKFVRELVFDPASLAMYKSIPPPNAGPQPLSRIIACVPFSSFRVDLKGARPSLLRREYMKDPGALAPPSVKNVKNVMEINKLFHVQKRLLSF